MSNIQERVVKTIVNKLGVKESEVTPEATFTGDLGADSLDSVELMMDFESEFGVEIPQEVAETMQSVGDVLNYLEAHKDEIK
ncbi:MAG: acyl carrier protein [Alistipes sp.]|nr:acyl carrier protein [Rikenellaceae bacterium]MBQ7311734.1 acyl carrier protein [Alistipes sp.]